MLQCFYPVLLCWQNSIVFLDASLTAASSLFSHLSIQCHWCPPPRAAADISHFISTFSATNIETKDKYMQTQQNFDWTLMNFLLLGCTFILSKHKMARVEVWVNNLNSIGKESNSFWVNKVLSYFGGCIAEVRNTKEKPRNWKFWKHSFINTVLIKLHSSYENLQKTSHVTWPADVVKVYLKPSRLPCERILLFPPKVFFINF